MSEPILIRYRFTLPNGAHRSFEFSFDAMNFRLINPAPANPPFWTKLQFNQCANCPLSAAEHPHCPVALQMVGAIDELKALASFDTVHVTVEQSERTVYAATSLQQAMSSVFGLIMATAGCPWADHLRPMARFHLPFAGDADTVYRCISMFVLAQKIIENDAASAYSDLRRLYENLHILNRDMARRIGAATPSDPARNAIALLDSYTMLLPHALEQSLAELVPLFEAWRPQPAQPACAQEAI
jgi:hypothetical protein